ncbi:hypothetical protein H8E88_29155 [candidate division KSB1 bacterium]|nr:hypothetical protein [candidate division KSB1 bacterium]
MNSCIRFVNKTVIVVVLALFFGTGNAQDKSIRELRNNCSELDDVINEYISSERINNFKDPKNKKSIFYLAKLYMLKSQFCQQDEWQTAIYVLNGRIKSRSGIIVEVTPTWDKNEQLKKTFLLAICSQKLQDYKTADTLYESIIKKDIPRSLARFNKSIILLNRKQWTSAELSLGSLLKGDDHQKSVIFPKDSHKYPIFRDQNFIDDAQFLLACCKYYKNHGSLAKNKKLRMEILAEFAKIERFYPGSDLADLVERKAFDRLIDFANGKDTKIIEKLFKAYMITLKNGLISKKELTKNYHN